MHFLIRKTPYVTLWKSFFKKWGMGMYVKIFKHCLLLPKKDALFFLNRIPMEKTIIYILLLMHIAFLPNLIKFSADIFQQYENISYSLFFIGVLVLYPFLTVFIMVVSITAFSFLAFLLAKMLKRKLAYQYFWKITAYAFTTPLMLYAVIETFSLTNTIFVLIPFLVWVYMTVKITLVYPKKTKGGKLTWPTS